MTGGSRLELRDASAQAEQTPRDFDIVSCDLEEFAENGGRIPAGSCDYGRLVSIPALGICTALNGDEGQSLGPFARFFNVDFAAPRKGPSVEYPLVRHRRIEFVEATSVSWDSTPTGPSGNATKLPGRRTHL